jgi:hypothetical protein
LNKPEAFIVVSRYKENLDWLPQLTDNYIVYNKGDNLDFEKTNVKKIIDLPNVGR